MKTLNLEQSKQVSGGASVFLDNNRYEIYLTKSENLSVHIPAGRLEFDYYEVLAFDEPITHPGLLGMSSLSRTTVGNVAKYVFTIE